MAAAPSSRRRFFGVVGRAGAFGLAASAAPLGGVGRPRAALAAATDGPTGLGELGYAQTVVSVSTTGCVPVPNLVLSVAPDGRPIDVEYGSYVSSSLASGLVKLYLCRDGVAVHEIGGNVAGPNGVLHLSGTFRLAPTSSESTVFSMLLANWGAKATVSTLAMPLSPSFLRARQG